MSKIDWERVKSGIETGCKVVAAGVVWWMMHDIQTGGRKCKFKVAVDEVSDEYAEAVEAIMKSDMFSSDKRYAVSALRQDGDAAFYKAIINIANDDSAFSSDKRSMIIELS